MGTLALFLSLAAGAQTEIFRCKQPDGTIAFQGQPCPEESEGAPAAPATSEASGVLDTPFDIAVPTDEPLGEPAEETTADEGPITADRAVCEQRTRDAIDAIDLEIRREYSPDLREDYLSRLRELTAELRACKQL